MQENNDLIILVIHIKKKTRILYNNYGCFYELACH